jgi:uncharacterized membrane protein
VSTASDKATVDEAIAAVEQSLRDDDFSPEVDDAAADDADAESDECRDVAEAMPGGNDGSVLPGETASAESDVFERGNPDRIALGRGYVESVSASAHLVESADDLDPILELLGDERLPRCFEEAFRRQVGADQADADISGVETERLVPEGLGDTGGGFQLTADVTMSGISAPISFAYEFARIDRAFVDIFIVTSAVGYDGPTADREGLLRVLVDAVDDQSG